MQGQNLRAEKGEVIANTEGFVRRIDEHGYKVHSQSGDFEYDVISGEFGWLCSCPDAIYRNIKCKHIWAVLTSINLRKAVESEAIIQPVAVSECLFCHSSNVKKFGIRRNKSGEIQRFLCGDCARTFSVNVGFERMKHNPQAITTALQLYFSGESLRNTQRSLRLLGVEVCHKTVQNWITKYVGLMEKYLDKITPNVSDTWRSDELFLKIKGNTKYLYAMMDDETRYWIAQEVADTKYTQDIRRLFQEARTTAGKKPKTLITDGGLNFRRAYVKEYWTKRLETRTKHIQDIRMGGPIHNNNHDRL